MTGKTQWQTMRCHPALEDHHLPEDFQLLRPPPATPIGSQPSRGLPSLWPLPAASGVVNGYQRTQQMSSLPNSSLKSRYCRSLRRHPLWTALKALARPCLHQLGSGQKLKLKKALKDLELEISRAPVSEITEENPLFTFPIRLTGRIPLEQLLIVHFNVAILGLDPTLLPDSCTAIPPHLLQESTSSTSTTPAQPVLAAIQPLATSPSQPEKRRVPPPLEQQVKIWRVILPICNPQAPVLSEPSQGLQSETLIIQRREPAPWKFCDNPTAMGIEVQSLQIHPYWSIIRPDFRESVLLNILCRLTPVINCHVCRKQERTRSLCGFHARTLWQDVTWIHVPAQECILSTVHTAPRASTTPVLDGKTLRDLPTALNTVVRGISLQCGPTGRPRGHFVWPAICSLSEETCHHGTANNNHHQHPRLFPACAVPPASLRFPPFPLPLHLTLFSLPPLHALPFISSFLVCIEAILTWLDYSPPTKVNWVQFPARSTPEFFHVGNIPDDAGWQIFLGISHFLHPWIPTLLPTHLASPASALKASMLRAFLWESRERIADALSADGFLYSYDLSFPHSCFYEPIEKTVQHLKHCSKVVRVCGFGHIGECNSFRGRGGLVVSLLASHQGESGSLPGWIFISGNHARQSRWSAGFPEISHFTILSFRHPHFTYFCSQDPNVKSYQNLFTHCNGGREVEFPPGTVKFKKPLEGELLVEWLPDWVVVLPTLEIIVLVLLSRLALTEEGNPNTRVSLTKYASCPGSLVMLTAKAVKMFLMPAVMEMK
ncbi:hypothetical protein PR048_023088 [Dryococelus australis]|uniref:Uncharacterized protein n=1 Tax=Dryococelus australis TaxID=614101 RepID=A0ABQ9GT62_9NEOP|nr:hypothetical protein PR048_023088 [Dryococelus australis]